jgi:hypothetical protein
MSVNWWTGSRYLSETVQKKTSTIITQKKTKSLDLIWRSLSEKREQNNFCLIYEFNWTLITAEKKCGSTAVLRFKTTQKW